MPKTPRFRMPLSVICVEFLPSFPRNSSAVRATLCVSRFFFCLKKFAYELADIRVDAAREVLHVLLLSHLWNVDRQNLPTTTPIGGLFCYLWILMFAALIPTSVGERNELFAAATEVEGRLLLGQAQVGVIHASNWPW